MKIQKDVIRLLETELDGLEFGQATLTVHMKEGNPRYEISRTRSIHKDTLLKGVDSVELKNRR
jgi:hypothetical protein